ncbi:MAG: hypothetical protein FWG79_08145 [Bacteroidales bacterium]|nr:hypothetical protein [Bacteroidales bacterium]
MKTLTTTILTATLLIALTTACTDREPSTTKRFDWDLRGTWVSNDPSICSGMLVIDYDRITISGYEEIQALFLDDDAKLPFRNFTKNIPLTGYSDSGYIYIMNAGQLQEGIPYTYWYETPPPTFQRLPFLLFTFGGRPELLRWVE